MFSWLSFVIITWNCALSIKWLGVEFPTDRDRFTRKDCQSLHRYRVITHRQKKLCAKAPAETLEALQRSAKQTKAECKAAFTGERWNCSSIERAPRFKQDLRTNTREAAFVQALSSASLAFQFAQDCFSNKECSCARKGLYLYNNQLPKYKGTQVRMDFPECMNSMEQGFSFAESFVKGGFKKKRSLSAQRSATLKLHNHAVGREVLRNKEEISCKCLSPSHSCTTRVCYKLPPFFKEVANELKERYKDSKLVNIRDVERKEILNVRAYDQPQRTSVDPIEQETNDVADATTRDDRQMTFKLGAVTSVDNHAPLYYEEASSDFCERDRMTGSEGTIGRVCSTDKGAIDYCGSLCCRRGHTMRMYNVTKKCRCQFSFEKMGVTCDDCVLIQIDHVCL